MCLTVETPSFLYNSFNDKCAACTRSAYGKLFFFRNPFVGTQQFRRMVEYSFVGDLLRVLKISSCLLNAFNPSVYAFC